MVGTFNLPDVGEGLTEAEVVAWRVAVGDVVEVNDVVVEIETAKSVVELPVPFAGEVRELLVEEGQTVEVGRALIRITEVGSPTEEDGQSHDGQSQESQPAAPGGAASPAESEGEQSGDEQADDAPSGALVGSGPKPDVARRRPRTRHTALDLVDASDGEFPPSYRAPSPAAEPKGPVTKASPPVRALAKRLGLAAWELVGSGGGGRITRDDVERQAEQEQSQRPGETTSTAPPAERLYQGPREEQVTVRGVRRATAANVTESAREVPHVSVSREIDVTRTMELRQVLREDPRYQGLSVSPLLFAAKAIIWALRRNPQINASWHETHYTLKNYVNLGIAAATPRGLVVPVIHDAQAYDTAGLAAAITDLTGRAREGKTPPAEMQSGTVSITNLGPLGLDGGSPILPPGQAAIIAVGAVRKKPWVVEDQIMPRDVMTVGGSFDHRLIDGDHAGHFVADVAAVLEQPGLLLG